MGMIYPCFLPWILLYLSSELLVCWTTQSRGLLQNIIVDLLLVACLFVLRPIYKNSPRQGILPAAQPLNNYRSFLGAVFSSLCNNSAANHSHCSQVYESSHFSVWHCFCWVLINKNRVSKGIPVNAKKPTKFNLQVSLLG